MSPIIERADTQQRYEIFLDGNRAGIAAYASRGEQRIFFHTEVDGAYARRGVAAQLVEHALGDTRASGKRIVPVCPYVARFLKRHEEFDDVIDPVTPEILQWLEGQLG